MYDNKFPAEVYAAIKQDPGAVAAAMAADILLAEDWESVGDVINAAGSNTRIATGMDQHADKQVDLHVRMRDGSVQVVNSLNPMTKEEFLAGVVKVVKVTDTGSKQLTLEESVMSASRQGQIKPDVGEYILRVEEQSHKDQTQLGKVAAEAQRGTELPAIAERACLPNVEGLIEYAAQWEGTKAGDIFEYEHNPDAKWALLQETMPALLDDVKYLIKEFMFNKPGLESQPNILLMDILENIDEHVPKAHDARYALVSSKAMQGDMTFKNIALDNGYLLNWVNTQEIESREFFKTLEQRAGTTPTNSRASTVFHTEPIAAMLLYKTLSDVETRLRITSEYDGRIHVRVASDLSMCLACVFTMFELKVLAARWNIDLQVKFDFNRLFGRDATNKDVLSQHFNNFIRDIAILTSGRPDLDVFNTIAQQLAHRENNKINDNKWRNLFMQLLLNTPLGELNTFQQPV